MEAIENRQLLAEAGMDVDDLLKRLMGNGKLIRVFVEKFLADTNYEKLTAAIAQRSWSEAESASHTLKGMCGNLSLTTLYPLFTEQVQYLRAEDTTKAAAMMPTITAAYTHTTTTLRAWLNG